MSRIDIVWDVYHKDSLKAATREKRGSGLRRKVVPSASIPGNWSGFLRVNENKEELFALLAKTVCETPVPGKQLVSTFCDTVLASPVLNDSSTL